MAEADNESLSEFGSSRGLVLAFTGQGSQGLGMGLELAEKCPVFADALSRVGEVLFVHLGITIRDLLLHPSLADTRLCQPAIFALQCALVETWSAIGLKPTAVLGHSLGEFAACVASGMLVLEDAAELVVLRGRLMSELPLGGGMLVVFGKLRELRPMLTPGISIAAINGPELLVVSGPISELDSLASRLDEEFIGTTFLPVSHAFHSRLMDPVLAPLERATKKATLHNGKIPMLSTMSGTRIRRLPQNYWRLHAQRTVKFWPVVKSLDTDTFILELGPAPVLVGIGRRGRPDLTWVPSLIPDAEFRAFSEAEAALRFEGFI